jgi:hypothetical protein
LRRVGVPNDSPTNWVAYRVMDGVTDLDRRVSGVPTNSPANAFAYQALVGVIDVDTGGDGDFERLQ